MKGYLNRKSATGGFYTQSDEDRQHANTAPPPFRQPQPPERSSRRNRHHDILRCLAPDAAEQTDKKRHPSQPQTAPQTEAAKQESRRKHPVYFKQNKGLKFINTKTARFWHY